MTLEMTNVKSLSINMEFPTEKNGHAELVQQISKINVGNLLAFKSPFSSIISTLEDAPLVSVRSENQSYSFNKKEFFLRISTEKLFPLSDMDKEDVEFNDELISATQAHYNLLMGMTVGHLKESSMDIEAILISESDSEYDFNHIINKDFFDTLQKTYHKGTIDITGFRFENMIEEDNIEYKYSYRLSDENSHIIIRYGKKYHDDVLGLSVKNIITEALSNINKSLPTW